jgi:hypothetical protein
MVSICANAYLGCADKNKVVRQVITIPAIDNGAFMICVIWSLSLFHQNSGKSAVT